MFRMPGESYLVGSNIAVKQIGISTINSCLFRMLAEQELCAIWEDSTCALMPQGCTKSPPPLDWLGAPGVGAHGVALISATLDCMAFRPKLSASPLPFIGHDAQI